MTTLSLKQFHDNTNDFIFVFKDVFRLPKSRVLKEI